MITFTSKQVLVQNMTNLDNLSKLTFVNNPGSLSAPAIQTGFGYLIPQSKLFIRLDFAKLLQADCVLDLKNLSAEVLDQARAQGVEVIQTKYFLKKDAYAIMFSRDIKRMLLCNVNERIVVST